MVTQQSQIKVNLPVQLKYFLELKAGKFSIPMAGYQIPHSQDVSKQEYPVFTSEKQKKHTNKHKRKKENS